MPSRPAHRTARRHCAAALAAALLALDLSGCAGGSGSGKTTITFWDNNGGPQRTPVYQKLIKDFEKANPEIHVKYVGIPSDSVQQKYDTAVVGGAGPDVGGVTTSLLAHLVGQDALEPLDARIAASPLKGKLNEKFTETVKYAGGGKAMYSVPSSGNLDIFWYRKDWFRQAGIPVPKTWDDVFAAARKLTDKSRNRYGFTIRGGAGSVFQILSEAYSYSGVPSFFDAQGKSTVDDPANVALIQKVAEQYRKTTPQADVNNAYAPMVAQFTNGTVAMVHHNLGSTGDVMKALGPEKAGAFALPAGPGGKTSVVPNPVDGFAVMKHSGHKDAAFRFVEFLVSHRANSYWNQKVGQIPANDDALGDAWVKQAPATEMAAKLLNDPHTVLAQAPVYLPDYSSITKTDTEPLFQEVLLGKKTAKQFASALAEKLTKAQQDWKKRH